MQANARVIFRLRTKDKHLSTIRINVGTRWRSHAFFIPKEPAEIEYKTSPRLFTKVA